MTNRDEKTRLPNGAEYYIRETFVNETKGYICGEGDWQPSGQSTLGDLYRSLRREYGRAAKMYVDRVDKPSVQIGWVFRKRMEYDDYRGHGERYYTREVWVSVSATCPQKRVVNINRPWESSEVSHA